uniref:Autophagy-related protein 3 n=1 Tax=Blastobotrys adeninivorans TaxID=409370 RepID=A0A060TAF3_BLAAD
MLQSTLSSLREWREYLTPVSHVSSFKSTGQITPEEFVIAGDYLVNKFPTWTWASASPSKQRDFLPADKQYLVTKHVPAHAQPEAPVDEGETVDDDGWVTTSSKDRGKHGHGDGDAGSGHGDTGQGAVEEIVDIDLEEEGVEDEEDDGAVYRTQQGTQTRTRTYNLYITYSTAYRVPKIYLSGFNAEGGPLTPNEMFEDIVADYKDKTVTIEKAPFEDNLTLISIHPCRHANVMRILLDRAQERLRNQQQLDDDDNEISKGLAKVGLADAADEEGEWEEIHSHQPSEDQATIRVDQYIVIFLKFISSVTPGIEHDYTMSVL